MLLWAPVALFGLWIAFIVVGPVVRTVVPIVVSTVIETINAS
jgi:hypothetical protein